MPKKLHIPVNYYRLDTDMPNLQPEAMETVVDENDRIAQLENSREPKLHTEHTLAGGVYAAGEPMKKGI